MESKVDSGIVSPQDLQNVLEMLREHVDEQSFSSLQEDFTAYEGSDF
jgi:hypothetical protein